MSKRDERGLRQLIKLAKEEGGKGVSYRGATIWLPRPPAAKQPGQASKGKAPEQGEAPAPRQNLPTLKKDGQRDAAHGSAEAGGNRQQRRYADRHRLQSAHLARLKLAECKLRVVQAMRRRFRWQRMQEVWTDWMRRRGCDHEVPSFMRPPGDTGMRKRAVCSTPASPSAATPTKAPGKKKHNGKVSPRPPLAAEARTGQMLRVGKMGDATL